jgi:hypothetical protein
MFADVIVIQKLATDGSDHLPVERLMMELFKKADNHQRPRDHSEKRCCPRYPFSPAVEAIDLQANTRIMGRLSDIARHGCYMDTISPFAVKADVTLMITRDNQSFKTQAQVVYSQVGMGMGLFFTTAEPEQLRLLETWLGELGGGKQREPDVPIFELQPDSAKSTDHQLRDILGELITLLSRKNIVSDSEGKAMLRKLF